MRGASCECWEFGNSSQEGGGRGQMAIKEATASPVMALAAERSAGLRGSQRRLSRAPV